MKYDDLFMLLASLTFSVPVFAQQIHGADASGAGDQGIVSSSKNQNASKEDFLDCEDGGPRHEAKIVVDYSRKPPVATLQFHVETGTDSVELGPISSPQLKKINSATSSAKEVSISLQGISTSGKPVKFQYHTMMGQGRHPKFREWGELSVEGQNYPMGCHTLSQLH